MKSKSGEAPGAVEALSVLVAIGLAIGYLLLDVPAIEALLLR